MITVKKETVMEINNSYMAGWLAGFFDGEGSVRFARYRRKDTGNRAVATYLSVCNTDKGVLDTAREYLDKLGIGYCEYEQRQRSQKDGYRRKPLYSFHITKQSDIVKFADLVGLRHAEKAIRLKQIVDHVNRPRYKLDGVMDQLVEMYYERQMSTRDIAVAMGYKPGYHNTISLAMRRRGYRLRSQAEGCQLAGNHKKYGPGYSGS